jgi:mannose-6-phosphate isomerase class I
VVNDKNQASIVIVTSGAVLAEVGGGRHALEPYEKFFLPAGIGPVMLTPLHGPAELLECFPPV